MTNEEQATLIANAKTMDEYRLANLKFTPDVIYDIGADIGSTALTAHSIHPTSKIIAVEPNPWSYPNLVKNTAEVSEIVPVNAAIGQGQLYEPPDCPGPLHWMVVDKDAPTWKANLVPSNVKPIMLDSLHAEYGGDKYVVKMDCESGEFAALVHEPSCQVIINSAYFAAELHIWASDGNKVPVVSDIIWRFLFRFAQTHTIHVYTYGVCVYVWALKRYNQSVVPFK